MDKYTEVFMQQRDALIDAYELLKKIKKLIKAINKLTASNQPVQILLDVISEDITRLLEG